MLDPKEEAKFAELKAMCRELHVPAPPGIMIGLKVHDKNGILVFDDVQRGHSITRNWYNSILYTAMGIKTVGSTYAAGSMCCRDTTGLIQSTYIYAGYDSSYNGIIVGAGDTEFAFENYILASKITSGNGAGQLLASTGTVGTPAYVSKVWTVITSKVFNNNSGSSITVKEVGLTCNVNALLIERSVLSPTVAVANGAQLTVSYQISMDFSTID
jgi:hypothetical protein